MEDKKLKTLKQIEKELNKASKLHKAQSWIQYLAINDLSLLEPLKESKICFGDMSSLAKPQDFGFFNFLLSIMIDFSE